MDTWRKVVLCIYFPCFTFEKRPKIKHYHQNFSVQKCYILILESIFKKSLLLLSLTKKFWWNITFIPRVAKLKIGIRWLLQLNFLSKIKKKSPLPSDAADRICIFHSFAPLGLPRKTNLMKMNAHSELERTYPLVSVTSGF